MLKEKLRELEETLGKDKVDELVGEYDSQIADLNKESAKYRTKSKTNEKELEDTNQRLNKLLEDLGIDSKEDNYLETAKNKIRDLSSGEGKDTQAIQQLELKLKKREEENQKLLGEIDSISNESKSFKIDSKISQLISEHSEKIGQKKSWVQRDIKDVLTFDDDGNIVAKGEDGIFNKPEEFIKTYLEKNEDLFADPIVGGSGSKNKGGSSSQPNDDEATEQAVKDGDMLALINANMKG